MFMKNLLLLTLPATLLIGSPQSFAEDRIKIEFEKSYDNYSNSDLKRRVWQLERAVAQLQDQVFQLAMKKETPTAKNWTCRLSSFGKTFVSSENTRSAALAVVIKKCSDETNAIHCEDSKASCDNE